MTMEDDDRPVERRRAETGSGHRQTEDERLLARVVERIEELEVDLQAALVRTELALAMPDLFRRQGKKNPRGRKTSAAKPGTPPKSGG